MHLKGTWVTIFFSGAFLLLSLVLSLALGDLFSLVAWHDKAILGDRFTLTTLIAVVLSALTCVYAGILNKKSKTFVEESVSELNKVAWPTWAETRGNTVTVVVTCIVAALILGVFDSVFSWITNSTLLLG